MGPMNGREGPWIFLSETVQFWVDMSFQGEKVYSVDYIPKGALTGFRVRLARWLAGLL